MRDNMQKIWQWIRDRKTNTIRKWRSSLVRSSTASQDLSYKQSSATINGYMPQSRSVGSLPTSTRSKPPEYEEFFDEPSVKHVLEVRNHISQTSRRSSDSFPVPPPDALDLYPNPYLDKLTAPLTSSPRSTPRTERKDNRQIRFQIPEVCVSCEEEEPQRIIFDDRRSSHPPPEIEWTPIGAMASTRNAPPIQSISFDMSSSNDISSASSTPRRNSASEKARQNLLAQRRQSNVQLVQEMTGRKTSSTTIIPLTLPQIHLIRSLWRQIYTTKGPTVIGQSIYHRLCFKSPIVKEQIRRVPLPQKFQNHDGFIKAHSKAMAELIDQVVENLDNLDVMTEELMRIGRVHARTLRGELTGKLWNVVAETFIDCTLEWGDKRCRSETVRKAWALIVAFVIEKIKMGHHEQRKKMLATRQSLPSIEVPMASLRF